MCYFIIQRYYCQIKCFIFLPFCVSKKENEKSRRKINVFFATTKSLQWGLGSSCRVLDHQETHRTHKHHWLRAPMNLQNKQTDVFSAHQTLIIIKITNPMAIFRLNTRAKYLLMRFNLCCFEFIRWWWWCDADGDKIYFI